MKRNLLVIAFLCALLVGFGPDLVQAQTGIVSIDHINGLSGGKLDTLSPLRIVFRMNNNTAAKMDISHGWEIYSPDGAVFDSVTFDSLPPNNNAGTPEDPTDDVNVFINRFDIVFAYQAFDGPLADTVGIIGAGAPTKASKQLPIGFNDTTIAIMVWQNGNEGNAGKTMCVDSAFWGVGGTWKWVGKLGPLGELVDVYPEWQGIGGATATPGVGFCYPFVSGAVTKTLVVSPTTLTFNATEGGANPATQPINISEAGAQALAWTATGMGSWLTVTPSSGNTPATPAVGVNITGLAAGTYKDTIVVNGTGASNTPQTVIVTLNVTAAPKTLVVTPDTLTFNVEEGGPLPVFQNFAVSVQGGGIIAYTATEATAWFDLQNATGNTPANVRVDITNSSLAPGTYVGSVTFTAAGATNSPLTRYVKYVVTQAPRVLAVEPVDLNFTAIEGGPSPAAQVVNVTETHGDNIDFTATGFASWINLTATDFTTPGGFTVNIDMNGVTEGEYKDTIVVASGTASNSPINVVVTLTVGAPSQKLLALTPDTLHFFAAAGGANPVSQSFIVSEAGGSNINFTASESSAWISLVNESGTTPDTVTVNVSVAALGAGIYRDSIMVTAGDADNSPVWEQIVLTVEQVACPELVLSDSVFALSILAGQAVDFTDTVLVSSTGPGEIEFSVTNYDAGWAFVPETGTTSASLYLTFSNTYPEPGTYEVCLQLEGNKVGDTTCVVTRTICLTITVNPVVTCADLLVDDSTISFTMTEGSGIEHGSLVVSRSDAGASAFTINRPLDATWLWFVTSGGDTVTMYSGMTTDTVDVIVKAAGLAPGFYQAISVIATDDTDVCQPRMKVFVVSLTIEGEPVVSGDSVIIGTAAASPGGVATVPISFVNGCDLLAAFLSLQWDPAYATLDSISYAGTRIPVGATLSDSILSGAATLNFEANNESQMTPPGTGLWANLFFGISPSTPLGTTVDVTVGSEGAWFTRNCGDSIELVEAAVMKGGVVVDTISESICGYVTDEEGIEIEGATVQLWANFPYGSPVATAATDENGAFFFFGPTPMPYDVYAFAPGYYPGLHEDMVTNQCGTIKLRKLDDLTPSDQWVDYYCGHNTFADSIPLPVGTVIEVRDPQGTLAGRQIVSEPGLYPFMPVYRDSSGSPEDEGAVTGDMLLFYINGTPAQTDPELVIYPAEYEQVQVCLNGNVSPQVCQMHEGWNLVSWRVDTPSDNIETVLGPIMDCIEVILGFEGGGLTYDPELQEFSTLWDVDHLSGYWIKVKQGCSPELTLNGTVVPANTPIPVYAGWNLVSYLPETALTPEMALTSVIDKLLIAYGFDMGVKVFKPGEPSFNTLEMMEPCFGYWMKLSGGDELIYPTDEPFAAARGHESPKALAARLAAPSDVTTTIAWVNLYARELTLDGQKVKAGAEVAAYSADGVKIGSYRLAKDGKFGFMPVYSDAGLSEEVTGVRPGDKFTVRVDGIETDQEFTWTTSGERLEIGRLTAKGTGNMPATYALAQNYPNPFNPTTKISFSLPNKGQARLEVYNILGKLVAVPFDGMAEAGSHEVVWDGRDSNGGQVASGVYFYRLTADKFTDTKKMMLLK